MRKRERLISYVRPQNPIIRTPLVFPMSQYASRLVADYIISNVRNGDAIQFTPGGDTIVQFHSPHINVFIFRKPSRAHNITYSFQSTNFESPVSCNSTVTSTRARHLTSSFFYCHSAPYPSIFLADTFRKASPRSSFEHDTTRISSPRVHWLMYEYFTLDQSFTLLYHSSTFFTSSASR